MNLRRSLVLVHIPGLAANERCIDLNLTRELHEGLRPHRKPNERWLMDLILLFLVKMNKLWLMLIAAAAILAAQSDAGGNAENGKRLFHKNGCCECHGTVGQGGVG
jgi:mono/diheme cytochrome c family protein